MKSNLAKNATILESNFKKKINFKRLIRVPKISDIDLSEHCENVQGFFFNIDLEQCESELSKIEELSLSNSLVSNGIIFVPVVKKHIADLIRIMERKKV